MKGCPFEVVADLAAVSVEDGFTFERRDAAGVQESLPSRCLSEDAWLWIDEGRRLLKQNTPRDEPGTRRWFAFLHAVRRYPVPETFSCSIPGAVVAGYGGAVFDGRNRFLLQSALKPMFPTPAQVETAPALSADRPVVPLLSAWADTNYCHWIFDALSKTAMVDDPQRYQFLIPDQEQPFHRQTLALCGIREDQILSVSGAAMRVPEVLVARTATHGAVPHRAVLQRLRARLLENAPTGAPFRKLYLTRGAKGRGVRNEEQILPVLRAAGFEVVDPGGMALAQQVALFAEAEVVLGAHGAAFVNTIFCRPGTQIVELYSPARWNACYLRIGALLELKHWHAFGERPDKNQAFEIAPAKLERLIAFALGEGVFDPPPW